MTGLTILAFGTLFLLMAYYQVKDSYFSYIDIVVGCTGLCFTIIGAIMACMEFIISL